MPWRCFRDFVASFFQIQKFKTFLLKIFKLYFKSAGYKR
jgi:hypothetical protein